MFHSGDKIVLKTDVVFDPKHKQVVNYGNSREKQIEATVNNHANLKKNQIYTIKEVTKEGKLIFSRHPGKLYDAKYFITQKEAFLALETF